MMRYVVLSASILAACSTEIAPTNDADATERDAGAISDANPGRADAEPGIDASLVDATVASLDAAHADASTSDGGSDGGQTDSGTDAGAPDAGPVIADAGPAIADAGPMLDGGPMGCVADPFEPNDTLETAPVVASSSSGLAETIDLTWHGGDDYDWIAFDVARPGFPGAIQVRAVDRLPGGPPGSGSGTADMRVSVRCVGSQLVWCHGGAVAPADRLSPCEEPWNPSISSTEMACGVVDPTLEVRVGMRRRTAPWITRCDHAAEVVLRPAGT